MFKTTPGRPAAWMLGIIALGAILRFQGLNWDSGRGFHPDEANLVRAALALGWPDALIPEFHAYNDLALWMPRLISMPICDAGDATCLRLAARCLSALFSTAQIWLAADIARRLSSPAQADLTAILAAGLVALSVPLLQWAHFGTTESALALVVLVLWAVAIRFQSGGMNVSRATILFSCVLGVGFGLKSTVVAMAIIPLCALIIGPAGPLRDRGLVLISAVAVCAVLALLSTPSLIFAPREWLAVMQLERDVVQGSADVFWTRQFIDGRHVLFELRQLWGMTEGVGLVLAVVGLWALPRSTRRLAAPSIVFAVFYCAIVFFWYAKFSRYLAPLIPIVLVFAALGGARILSTVSSLTVRMLAFCGLGLFALTGLDFAASYLASDPRILAERWLERRAGPDDLVAIEPHDVSSTAGRTSVVLPLDTTGPEGATAALATVLSTADWYLIASRRNWSVLPKHPATQGKACGFYTALAQGSLGFTAVEHFDRASPFGALLAPGLRAEETRLVFDRPQVILFQNTARLSADVITHVLSEMFLGDGCSLDNIATGLALKW